MSKYESLSQEDNPSLALLPTLDVFEAAKLLRAHPETVRVKARTGEIPAKKVGRGWIFSVLALEQYLLGEYRPRVVQGDTTHGGELCRSTNAVTAQTGITSCIPQEMEKLYKEALAPLTKSKHRNSTTD